MTAPALVLARLFALDCSLVHEPHQLIDGALTIAVLGTLATGDHLQACRLMHGPHGALGAVDVLASGPRPDVINSHTLMTG